MSKIAILGFGTIGKGVFEVIEKNADKVAAGAGKRIEVSKVLDIRDLSGTPAASVAVKDISDVVSDASVSTVVECMGGKTFAYEFTKAALRAKKNVVTSNKEVVCAYGDELMALAAENGVAYLFEASVGGGIPIIHPMRYCLAANVINGVCGILNGTTNFMLTMMNESGASFDEALSTAQRLGYAEKEPSADVDGFDAARKIAILSSIACGSHVALEDVSVIEGIRKITAADVRYADAAGKVIKLLARSVMTDGGAYVYVAPHLIDKTDPLASVSDVFNAVSVDCNMLGRAQFYGRGAGSLPTASAVVSDVIEAERGGAYSPAWSMRKEGYSKDAKKLPMRFFVRAELSSKEKLADLSRDAVAAFGTPDVLSEDEGCTLAFITDKMTCAELERRLSDARIKGGADVADYSVIRVY